MVLVLALAFPVALLALVLVAHRTETWMDPPATGTGPTGSPADPGPDRVDAVQQLVLWPVPLELGGDLPSGGSPS